MNVKELIQKLQELPPESKVLIRDDFEGYNQDCELNYVVKEVHGVVLRLVNYRG